jgi:flavorubredoxin
MKKMQAIFTNAGVDRDQRLAASSAILQRGLTTASDLTKDEATVLIDTLEGLAESGDLKEQLDALVDPTLPNDPDLGGGVS